MKNHYLICYDISNNKTRNRVVKILNRHGGRKQYSVFLLEASKTRILKVKHKLQLTINPEDSLMICQITHIDALGTVRHTDSDQEYHIY